MGLYDKTIVCLNCDEEFKSKAVKVSATRLEKTDQDGCNHYKGKSNPYLYQVFACPHCGFAFTQSFFLVSRDKALIKTGFVNKLASVENYCGERSIEESINVWKLALVTGQVSNQKTESLSGISLRIAWLYRYLGDKKNEDIFLKMSMNGYKQAYKNDDLMNSAINVIKIIFQASIQLKDVNEARIWLNELYKFRDSDLIIDAKEQFDNLRKTTPESSVQVS
nr:DUF2225 domain-containing protein [Tissierella sp.]